MRLLYIAAVDFFTKPNPSYHLMTSMLEDTLDNGIDVTYIGCEEEGVEKHIPETLLKRKNFSYHLVPIPKVSKSQFIKRYISGISYSMNAAKLIKKHISECDFVFVQSSPTVLYTLYYARKYAKGKKVIYNVQDMFPGSSIASGVMPQKWMQKIFYSLQKIAYKKADYITAISEDMKDKLVEQGVEPEKIKVILNWFDDKSVSEIPWDKNRFVEKYSLKKDVFYVQYAGTMGYVFDYEMVLNVAQRLKDYKDIVIQMIGEGSQKEDFIKAAEERKLDNIVFLPLEPQEMVSDVYSACSICFIPLKKGIIGNSVPSKAGLLMACKRAIVSSVDENTDYYNMINEYSGIAVPTDSPDEAAQAILRLKNLPEDCKKYGESGYIYGKELYSRTNNMNKYLDLFFLCAKNSIKE